MGLKTRIVTCVCLLIVGCIFSVHAKCPKKLIIFHGHIEGRVPENASLELKLSPEPGYPLPRITLVADRFEAKIEFDTFKSSSWFRADNCSRKPISITLILKSEGREIASKTLQFKDDFELTTEGYRSKSEIILSPLK